MRPYINEMGTPQLQQGVARNRRLSIEDPPMRQGRKSRWQRVDGYKRHVLRALDSGLIPCVGVTPAHAPDDQVTLPFRPGCTPVGGSKPSAPTGHEYLH